MAFIGHLEGGFINYIFDNTFARVKKHVHSSSYELKRKFFTIITEVMHIVSEYMTQLAENYISMQ